MLGRVVRALLPRVLSSAGRGAKSESTRLVLHSRYFVRQLNAASVVNSAMDWEKFRLEGHKMVDFIADYMQTGAEAAPGVAFAFRFSLFGLLTLAMD
jgi:hypothetical protein